MDWLIIIKQIILAGFGTLFFAISLIVNKKDLPYVGFMGSICYGTYLFFLKTFSSYTSGIFMAALIIAFLSIFISKQKRKPITVFLAAGVVPILPGYAIFKMLLGFVEQDNIHILTFGAQALKALLIIASAIVIASSISKMIDYVVRKKIL